MAPLKQASIRTVTVSLASAQQPIIYAYIFSILLLYLFQAL